MDLISPIIMKSQNKEVYLIIRLNGENMIFIFRRIKVKKDQKHHPSGKKYTMLQNDYIIFSLSTVYQRYIYSTS
jgi:hypothetical protein